MFGIDAKDSDAVYEITWYQGNKLISTGQASSLNGDKRTATLSNSPKKVFNLGTTVSMTLIIISCVIFGFILLLADAHDSEDVDAID